MKKISLVLFGIMIIVLFLFIPDNPGTAYPIPTATTARTLGPTATREPIPTYPPTETPVSIPTSHPYYPNAQYPEFDNVFWHPSYTPYLHVWLVWKYPPSDWPYGAWPIPYNRGDFHTGYIFGPYPELYETWYWGDGPSHLDNPTWHAWIPCPSINEEFNLNACVKGANGSCFFVGQLWYGSCGSIYAPTILR